MPQQKHEVRLTAGEVATAFQQGKWAEQFPPILSVEQAAAVLQVPKQTIYDWRSRGLLKGCGRKVGKHLRFFRDRLVLHVMNGGLDEQ